MINVIVCCRDWTVRLFGIYVSLVAKLADNETITQCTANNNEYQLPWSLLVQCARA